MPSGADAYIRYKREAGTYTDHSVAGDSTWKVFGNDLKATFNGNNNMRVRKGLGGRQGTGSDPLAYDASIDLDFSLSNPWWLRLFIGQAATKTGAGPYSYYWLDTANENSGGAVTLPNSPIAFTIENGFNLATDSVRSYKGAFLSSVNISAALDGPVAVKAKVPFRKTTKTSAGIGSQEADTFDNFTFAHGAVKLPTGTTLAEIQNVSLDLDNSLRVRKGLGSRFITGADFGDLKIGLKASMEFVADADILDYHTGSTTDTTTPTATTLDLVFDNGLASTSQRLISFKFTGVYIDQYTIAQAVENPLIDEWTPSIEKMTLVKSINNTASEP